MVVSAHAKKGSASPEARCGLKVCLALALVVGLVQLRAHSGLRVAEGAPGAARHGPLRRAWLPRPLYPEDDRAIDETDREHWRRDNARVAALLDAHRAAGGSEPGAPRAARAGVAAGAERGGASIGDADGDVEGADAPGGESADGEVVASEADDAHMAGMDALVRDLEQAGGSPEPSGARGADGGDASTAPAAAADTQAGGSALSITLVSQTSEERIWMIEHLCDRWAGPLAISVHVRGSPHKVMAVHQRADRLAACGSTSGEPRLTLEVLRGKKEEAYPINKLRNLAISRVTTTHMLLVDIDLWPSAELYAVLLNALNADAPVDPAEDGPAFTLREAKLAIIAPAFELSASAFEHLQAEALAPKVPRTFSALKDCHAKGNCFIFKKSTNTHRSTDYERWWQQRGVGAYQVGCFDSIRYEPYVVVPVRARGVARERAHRRAVCDAVCGAACGEARAPAAVRARRSMRRARRALTSASPGTARTRSSLCSTSGWRASSSPSWAAAL